MLPLSALRTWPSHTHRTYHCERPSAINNNQFHEGFGWGGSKQWDYWQASVNSITLTPSIYILSRMDSKNCFPQRIDTGDFSTGLLFWLFYPQLPSGPPCPCFPQKDLKNTPYPAYSFGGHRCLMTPNAPWREEGQQVPPGLPHQRCSGSCRKHWGWKTQKPQHHLWLLKTVREIPLPTPSLW